MDTKDEADRLMCERLDAVDRAANRIARFEWPRFDITTVLRDYVEGDLVYEFTDLQPTYGEANAFVRRVFIESAPKHSDVVIQFNRRPDFVLFNVCYYFTLLWVSLRDDTEARFQQDKIVAMNTGFARFDAEHNPPELSEEECWLFKHGQVRGSDGKPYNKPRTFKFESMGFGWRPT